MKQCCDSDELHSRIDWDQIQGLRHLRTADRCTEVLKGLRLAGIDDYISCSQISRIMRIQAGSQYSSTPSNIMAALQKTGNQIEKRIVDKRLRFRFATPQVRSAMTPDAGSIDTTLLSICDRFHRSIAHLRRRRKGKSIISFSDEYDVQDVFGTVLKCCYEDVRDEEWCPSYAGNSARMDFIIVDHHTATELKRARDKQAIADELTLDIAHYRKHPDVKKLVCFVYDPEAHLSRDAIQIERDLSGTHQLDNRSLSVVVLIRPK